MPDATAVKNKITRRHIQRVASLNWKPMLKCHIFSKPGIKMVTPKISPMINAKNVMTTFSVKNWTITILREAPMDFLTAISFNRLDADTMAILI